ncbi:MAG: tetratricopeptide repeat protein, partial [Candidatus Aegiribacteria sp.]|nr:tetratricopeptide repeat protein [Candidatus Aegiribacteria sp.]
LTDLPRQELAVMFTDIAGFTSMMERSENRALETIGKMLEIQNTLLKKHDGRLVKVMGDGTLCTFESPVDSVRCARDLQSSFIRLEIPIRIGIHWGKVLLKPDDVLGDPVNVASRLEELAPSGGICVSGELLRNYGRGRKPSTRALGLRKLKGLGRLVDLFAIKGSKSSPLPVDSPVVRADTADLDASGKDSSVAVIPLVNLGEQGDDFFAYSISADLVSSLSRAGRLIVTPLSDILTLKKAVGSEKEVAERLNVRFLVRGTLWRKDKRFQLSVELLDQARGCLVWSDNWIDDWFELPSIKNKLADSLLKALGLENYDIPGIATSESSRLEAYEKYLEAQDLFRKKTSAAEVEKARKLLISSLNDDPLFVSARNLLGALYSETGFYNKAEETLEKALDMAQEQGERFEHLDALNRIGINQWKQCNYKAARNTFMRTLRISRALNDTGAEARALSNIGLMNTNMGMNEKGLKYLEQSLKVTGFSEVSGLRANTLCNIGLTYWHMGDNPLAQEYYNKALSIFNRLEDLNGQAYIMRNIGILKRNIGLVAEAADLTENAYQIYRELGNRQGQCHSLNSIGNIKMYLGMYGEAQKIYREALNIACELDDKLMESVLKTNSGSIEYMRGNYHKAISIHTEALNISRQIDDLEGVAENTGHLANAYRMLGQNGKAMQAYEEYLNIMQSMDADSRTAHVRTKMAGLSLSMDNSGLAVKDVLDQIHRVESILTFDAKDRTLTLWELSKLYSELARSVEKNRQKRWMKRSREYLEEAYNSLMESAENITEESSRESFLQNVGDHRDIIQAYKEIC